MTNNRTQCKRMFPFDCCLGSSWQMRKCEVRVAKYVSKYSVGTFDVKPLAWCQIKPVRAAVDGMIYNTTLDKVRNPSIS